MKIQSNLKRLLVSRTRFKLIQIFFYSPQNFFYVRQLVRLTGEEINSVRRELSNLKSAGILFSESRANKLYYWANSDSPLFVELLTFANKTVGLGQNILEKIDKFPQLKLLFYCYRFAVGSSVDSNAVDIVFVGDLLPREIEAQIADEQQRRGREINYMIMSKSEYRLRRQKRDPFIVDFFLDYPLLIIGSVKNISPNG